MKDKKKSDFERTGVSFIKTKMKIKVTERDMVDKLVKEVEGKNIKIGDINKN